MIKLMKLGSFTFELKIATFESLSNSYKFEWSSKERGQKNPSREFTSWDITKSLSGVFYPGKYGSYQKLLNLINISKRGVPQMLIGGDGTNHGWWVVTQISEDQKFFRQNGTPRKIEFSMELSYFGESWKQ